jgi:AraC-like DNA-binding protein
MHERNPRIAPAKAVGVYREVPPPPALAGLFQCAWSHRAPSEPEPIAVLPDGCVDIVWVNGALQVAGPDRTAAQGTLAPATVILGLRFRPGAAARLLRVSMGELVDQRVPLDAVWGSEARRLADWVGEKTTVAERAERLATGVARWATDLPPDDEMGALFTVVADGGVPVADLTERFNISERTLRRRCHQAFGYGPKTLDRILRFQRFVRLAQSGGLLAHLALDAGYADQAHLAREVQALSGMTPSTLVRDLRT